jgi:hypothetical protein
VHAVLYRAAARCMTSPSGANAAKVVCRRVQAPELYVASPPDERPPCSAQALEPHGVSPPNERPFRSAQALEPPVANPPHARPPRNARRRPRTANPSAFRKCSLEWAWPLVVRRKSGFAPGASQ